MKICSRCKIKKTIDCFHKNKRYKDGVFCTCKECKTIDRKKYYLNNKFKELENNKKYYKENQKDISLKRAEYLKEWTENNRDKSSKAAKKWKQKNIGLVNFYTSSRRAKKANATPKWVDRNVLMEIYKNCPPGYHVDHIIPLNHPDVCGLHVPWNLQYLTAEENVKKNNKCDIFNMEVLCTKKY
jgi:hypothetical protein